MAAPSTERTELERYLRLMRVFLAAAAALLVAGVFLASIERSAQVSTYFYGLGLLSGILFIGGAVKKWRHHSSAETVGVRSQPTGIPAQFDGGARKGPAIGNEDPLLLDCLLLVQRLQETHALIHRMRTGAAEISGRGSKPH
jgi:hypothetical protein